MTTQLTDHFSLEEMTRTSTGLPNTPDDDQLDRLKNTAKNMEAVRALLDGHPIDVHSGFRSDKVNAAVGGAKTSAHRDGDACDFVCPGFGSTFDVAVKIRDSGLAFDQLILEYGWVHISFAAHMRGECLTKRSSATPYEKGINK